MNSIPAAIRIFRKDMVQQWPRAILFAALLGVLCWQDSGQPDQSAVWYPASPLIEIPFLLACFYLAACVIQAEGPVADCPYWVARPVPRRGLLAGKLLTLAVCLNLPVFVGQSCVLAANGLSPLDHLPILFWRQVFFTERVVLPAAALAAVTGGLAWFAAGALVYLGLMYLPAGSWLGWEWIRTSFLAALSLGAAAWVLAVQFTRRETERSRVVLASAGLAILLCQFLPWRVGFAIQSAFSANAVQAARIVFAPSRRPFLRAQTGRVQIPVDVSGLSADQGARVEGIRTAIDAPGGRHWDSGWDFAGQPVFSAENLSPRAILPADGPYWLAFRVSPEFYDAVKSAPVHLHATLALTLLGDTTSTNLNLGGVRIVNDTAVCYAHGAGASVSVVCSSPFWNAARSTLRVRSQSTGESVARELLLASKDAVWTYGPYPTSALLSLWTDPVYATVNAPAFPIDIILDTHPPAAFAERTLDIPAIRLADYQP